MNSDDSLPPPSPSGPPLDPALEARIIACVHGEASPAEIAEIDRLCAEHPALADFRRRIVELHGLAAEAFQPAPGHFRLAPERRAKLLAELNAGPAHSAKLGDAEIEPIAFARPRRWQDWAFPAAACLALIGLLGAVVFPTVGGHFGVASESKFQAAAARTSELRKSMPAQASAPAVDGFAEAESTSRFAGGKNNSPTWGEDRVEFQPRSNIPGGPPPPPPASPAAAPAPALSGELAKGLSAQVSRRAASREKKDSDSRFVSGATVSFDAELAQSAANEGALGITYGSARGAFEKESGGLNRADADPQFAGAAQDKISVSDTNGLAEAGRQVGYIADFKVRQEANAPVSVSGIVSSGAETDAGTARREATRAKLIAEVAKSWQHPGVFNESDAKQKDLPATDTDAAKPAQRPAPDASLRRETPSSDEPVSTFSLHVSDASFRLARAALARGEFPDPASVRPEEFYNAFDYGDPAPRADEPVAARVEQAAHPLLQQRNLLRVALRVPAAGRSAGQPLRLTLLLDTSGSMEREDRAATVRAALTQLATLLGPADRVTLVGFSRTPRLLADRLPGDQAATLAQLAADTPPEGGTNLDVALKLAADLAFRQFDPAAQNRIVLLTDGAANLGDADPAALSARVVQLRQKGVAFDACGVGANGLDDGVLEALTRQGDGRYLLLDSADEAGPAFARQLAGAFRPAAQNVKVQVRFNPDRVPRYRLIGFEQHRLREEDFRNDQVDAAELASAEAAVALYQVEVDPQGAGELGEVFVRFRETSTGRMIERSWPLPYDASAPAFDRAAPSLQLAGASALLAEKLQGGDTAVAIRLADLDPIAAALRAQFVVQPRVVEFLDMLSQARRLSPE